MIDVDSGWRIRYHCFFRDRQGSELRYGPFAQLIKQQQHHSQNDVSSGFVRYCFASSINGFALLSI